MAEPVPVMVDEAAVAAAAADVRGSMPTLNLLLARESAPVEPLTDKSVAALGPALASLARSVCVGTTGSVALRLALDALLRRAASWTSRCAELDGGYRPRGC